MIQIRQATNDDIPRLIELLTKFGNEYCEYVDLGGASNEYKVELLTSLIAKHIVFVADREGYLIGTIGGLVAPHIFNPNVISVNELFWYVDEDYRSTSAGAKLLLEFKLHAQKIADLVFMALIDSSGIKPQSLIKRGFIPKETHYLLGG